MYGVTRISGIEYLTYHISKEHPQKYITGVFYDIQKETDYKNILILADDISRIDLSEFAFGINSVIIIEDKDADIVKLENLYKPDWHRILRKQYNGTVHLSEYDFCDYIVNGYRFVSTFYMLDTEKANRINLHMLNKNNKPIDVVCNKEILSDLKKVLPTVNLIPANLSKELERDVKMYE